MFHEAVKRERQGDTLTGKQNSSVTIGKSQSGLLHLLLLRVTQAAFSHYCW